MLIKYTTIGLQLAYLKHKLQRIFLHPNKYLFIGHYFNIHAFLSFTSLLFEKNYTLCFLFSSVKCHGSVALNTEAY